MSAGTGQRNIEKSRRLGPYEIEPPIPAESLREEFRA